MQKKTNLLRSAVVASLVAASVSIPVTAAADRFAVVINDNDAGPGSLRHALEVKKASRVMIAPHVGDIKIMSTLQYDRRKALTIKGHGQTVTTDINTTLLAVTEGASLKITNLNFAGPGGFSISNRSDLGGDAGKGIFIDVRDNQTGKVVLDLSRVSVSGVANHGVHVSDCSLADDCGGGSGGGGEGSPASVVVRFNRVSIDDVGNGKLDADGLRVDERGGGDIIFFAHKSSFTNVGADGVELDEGNAGNVYSQVSHSDFSDNGAYCDPELLKPFLPDHDEAKFAENDAVTEADIPPKVSGSPDDDCFEREVDKYDSGFIEAYEFGIDLDDGFDIDEAGSGSLLSSMYNSTISGNLDEGVDFDEEDAGMIWASYVRTKSFANNDDGFKHSEEGSGNVNGQVVQSSATDNGGKGFVFEEEDAGDLYVTVYKSSTSNNDDGDNTGIEVVQEDDGEGKLKVRTSDIADGIDTDGVDEI